MGRGTPYARPAPQRARRGDDPRIVDQLGAEERRATHARASQRIPPQRRGD
ncbi:hypothetical protein [Glycomyces sp. NPDC048151]|uniref:hypothetical protein n=1 Tax=Glycomyces sp. NPDC048151 TaxID=3364002 RepID=UPI003714C5EF